MGNNSSLPEVPSGRSRSTTSWFHSGILPLGCRQTAEEKRGCGALPALGADKAQYGTLLVLADGIGGLPGGAEASHEAVSCLQALYYSKIGSSHPADRLRDAVGAVNALICFKQRQLDYQKGYLTTLVAAVTLSDQIWIANVGDSRAYRIQADNGQIQQLTEDHSGHVRNVKSGLASEFDIASQRTGVITRAIGLSEDCQVDTYHYTWQLGDRLLLCSDGLNSLPSKEIIAITLQNPADNAARELVSHAVEIDGSDNCTAMVAAWLLPEEAQNQPAEDRQITLLKKPQAQPQTETAYSQEVGRPEGNLPVLRHPRRSFWVDMLDPVLIGVLVGLAISILVAMILLQMNVISLNF